MCGDLAHRTFFSFPRLVPLYMSGFVYQLELFVRVKRGNDSEVDVYKKIFSLLLSKVWSVWLVWQRGKKSTS